MSDQWDKLVPKRRPTGTCLFMVPPSAASPSSMYKCIASATDANHDYCDQ